MKGSLLAALAGLMLVGASCSHGGEPAVRARSLPTSPSTHGSSATDPSYVATLSRLDSILAAAPLLPHSAPESHVPSAALARAPYIEGTGGDVLTRTRWITAPGSIDSAVAYYQVRRPAWATSWGISGPIAGDPSIELYCFGSNAPAYQQPALDLTVVKYARGVAVRLSASAIWNPSRPTQEYATEVTAVEITVLRPGRAPTVHRTVTGTLANRLAQLLNASPTGVGPPGPRECGPINAMDFHDDLVFHTASGPITAIVHVLGICSSVTLSAAGAATTTVQGDLDIEVLVALGLPLRYGGM